MTRYAQFTGTAGDQTLIDDTYFNRALTSKGTATSTAATVGSQDFNIGVATITVSGTSPQIAWGSEVKAGLLGRTNNGDGTFTFRLLVAPKATNFTYYIFDKPPVYTGPPTARARFKDATGAVVFDSIYNYMRIEEYLPYGQSDQGGAVSGIVTDLSSQYNAGKTLAVAQAWPTYAAWFHSQAVPPNQHANITLCYAGMAALSPTSKNINYGNSVVYQNQIVQNGANDGDLGTYASAFIVIDVSNM